MPSTRGFFFACPFGCLFFHHFLQGDFPVPSCPQCQSPRVETLDRCRTAGAAIGAVAGAASGAASALRAAQLGATYGALVGPAGSVLGAVAGVAMGGLTGGAVGCEIGNQIGKTVDQNCLKNHHCLECDHRFRDPYA